MIRIKRVMVRIALYKEENRMNKIMILKSLLETDPTVDSDGEGGHFLCHWILHNMLIEA